jgi:hypothetical protein
MLRLFPKSATGGVCLVGALLLTGQVMAVATLKGLVVLNREGGEPLPHRA